MKVTGARDTWERVGNGHTSVRREFSFEVPNACHCLFDASQSTLVVKNVHGHVRLALKGITQFWDDSMTVDLVTQYSDHEDVNNLKKQMSELQAELAFMKETHG